MAFAMLRLRRFRRSSCLVVVLLVTSVCYLSLWAWNGEFDERIDVLDFRFLRGDHMTQKPKAKDPPPILNRHLKVKERCKLEKRPSPRKSSRSFRFPEDPFIVHKPKMFFCPLAKAGSTFFTRYMMALKKEGTMENPYKIHIKDAGRDKQSTFLSIHSLKEQEKFLNESTKVVFTRNPYSRIFAAYVDKLFSPNPYYWKDWGKRVMVLNKLKEIEHPCGSGVSFKDFIKIVIFYLWKTDIHFIPMDKMCQFCDIDYDVIGRIEESSTDIEFLSNKLHVSTSFLHEQSYKRSAVEDAIKDSTGDVLLEWREKISNCISGYESGQIVWRKLQLRGLIDAGIEFPFNELEMESVTQDDFRRECFKAADNSRDLDRLKRQKLIAYQYAYNTLSQTDIIKLQQIYKTDFMLLDYDTTRPDASISSLGGLETSDPFDWSADWEFV